MSQTTQYDPRIAPLTLQLKDDPHPQRVYAQKAADVRFERSEDGVVVLYRHSDITAVNRHPAVLGNGGRGGSFGQDAALIPLEVDGEAHRAWRRLLDPIFAPKKIAFLEDQIRALARELIADFAGTGRAELHDSFCVPLPCLTFLRLLGAPVDKLDFFLEFKDGVVHPEGDTVDEMNANMAIAGAKILEYFVGFLAERRAETELKDDVVSTLLHSHVDGRPITDEEFYNVMFLFMFAGLDTVTSSLSCIFAWLGQHPQERDRLVADPSLIPVAVEELLRFESPVPSGMRYAEEDIDLGDGLVIRAGEAVHAFWAAANVDPTTFENPLTVDLDRGRTNHIVFASGTHRCLGSHLARLELRIAVEELLAAVPDYEIDSQEPLTYDNVAVRCATSLPIRFTPHSL
ncbi:cytochrome P450 [Mycobacterium sp. M26]|uniref:cytochrome P450 n=1 Tax=Mycobacterium sp. M26 TaxID=1762962 RepID=UPI00073E8283|nr:cytochrome P450 [Mycobacterium sp. M26]